jgi:azurin
MKTITNKVRQVDAFGGFTSAAGHNFYTARAFPKKYWNKIAFVAEPTGHVLHQNNLIRKGTDYQDKEAFNLMAGADEWFAPVFAETGPDGAVWVADWYSYIIQHNPVPKGFDNGAGNAYETDLRDYTHGRIYRVSAKEAPKYTPLSLSKSNEGELVNALKNDNMFWRMQAQRLLVERGQKDIVPELKKLVADYTLDEIGINAPAIHALWTLKGLNALTDDIIDLGLKHPSSDVRKNTIKVMDFSAKSVGKILSNNLLYDKDSLVILNSLLLFSKSPLDAVAEKAYFTKLNSIKEVQDRWMPDAFTTVLTANNAKLLKKHIVAQAKIVPEAMATAAPTMNHAAHDHSKMMGHSMAVKGVDLIISDIVTEPVNPAVRERISVTVKVKNQGDTDLPAESFVPLDLSFEGQGMKVNQVSRNYKEGIKAGETVSITRNINGPWVGNISFYTDIMGEYNLRVSLDKNNEITEANKNNNNFTKKITFSAPASMAAYTMERGIRSYASVAPVDSLIALLKRTQKMDAQARSSIIKAMSEGWNYNKKDVAVKPADKTYLLSLNKIPDSRLTRLLTAWKVMEELKPDANPKLITIKAVREEMKYDTEMFTVKAGQTVEITFENPDAMQHNLVVVKPKSMEKVGMAGDKMMMDQRGAEKNYVPDLPEVLFATPLVNPGQMYKLVFRAPAAPGEYPYVCTFPGHWSIMNGVMKVE